MISRWWNGSTYQNPAWIWMLGTKIPTQYELCNWIIQSQSFNEALVWNWDPQCIYTTAWLMVKLIRVLDPTVMFRCWPISISLAPFPSLSCEKKRIANQLKLKCNFSCVSISVTVCQPLLYVHWNIMHYAFFMLAKKSNRDQIRSGCKIKHLTFYSSFCVKF